jgi:hypothetical protein
MMSLHVGWLCIHVGIAWPGVRNARVQRTHMQSLYYLPCRPHLSDLAG